MHDDDTAKATMLARYARTAADAGHEHAPVPHVSAHLAFVADTVERAEAVLRAALPGWLATTRESTRIDGSAASARDLDAHVDRLLAMHPVGPPPRRVERLTATLAATGAQRLLLMVEGAGEPRVRSGYDHAARRGVLPTQRTRDSRR